MFADRWARIGSTAYVVLGLAWAYLSRQPSPAWLESVWFVTVAAVGGMLRGPANQVSLARAYLAAPALVYAMHQDFALVAIVVAIAGVTDLVDGTIARRFATPSQFGGGLDPVVDGVFTGGLVIGLALGGTFPAWLALVVVARYLLPALAGGVLIATGRRPELRHTVMGQVSTVLIFVLIGGVCLFRALRQDSSEVLNSAEVVIPIVTIAAYIHLGFALRRPAAAPEAG
jgi:phosphatidylglycerophosphate synthase